MLSNPKVLIASLSYPLNSRCNLSCVKETNAIAVSFRRIFAFRV